MDKRFVRAIIVKTMLIFLFTLTACDSQYGYPCVVPNYTSNSLYLEYGTYYYGAKEPVFDEINLDFSENTVSVADNIYLLETDLFKEQSEHISCHLFRSNNDSISYYMFLHYDDSNRSAGRYEFHRKSVIIIVLSDGSDPIQIQTAAHEIPLYIDNDDVYVFKNLQIQKSSYSNFEYKTVLYTMPYNTLPIYDHKAEEQEGYLDYICMVNDDLIKLYGTKPFNDMTNHEILDDNLFCQIEFEPSTLPLPSLQNFEEEKYDLDEPIIMSTYHFDNLDGRKATLYLEMLELRPMDSYAPQKGKGQFRLVFEDTLEEIITPTYFEDYSGYSTPNLVMKDYNGDGDQDFIMSYWASKCYGCLIYTIRPNGIVEVLPVIGEPNIGWFNGIGSQKLNPEIYIDPTCPEEINPLQMFVAPTRYYETYQLGPTEMEAIQSSGFVCDYYASGADIFAFDYIWDETVQRQLDELAPYLISPNHYQGLVRAVYEWQEDHFVPVRQELVNYNEAWAEREAVREEWVAQGWQDPSSNQP